MAKLNKEETLALTRIFVRAQNLLKGCALDTLRMVAPETPEDRQFTAMTKAVKDKEQALRKVFMSALVEAGISEELSNEELFNQAMK